METDTPEAQLLSHAKEGRCSPIQRLLQSGFDQMENKHDITYSLGWTPLHLACYCGHTDVVEELLKAGADVNLQNNMGDTPLHSAAFTGRKDVVLLLLRYDACAKLINGTAQIPKDVTDDDEIITMLEAAETRETRRRGMKLLEAAREGHISTLSELLSAKEAPDIHCRDSVGNTPLHCAAYRGQKQCIIKLLKSGASPCVKNSSELFFSTKDVSSGVQKIEGPLWKSSRFLGWRSHWVVLEDGTLSWYPRQANALAGVRKQGCKSLTQAYCMVKPWDHCFFTLSCFDGTVHYFKVPSKTDSIATRKRWLDAFEAHSSYSTRHCIQEQTISDEDGDNVYSHCLNTWKVLIVYFLFFFYKALAAPLLLKAKETSELSSETCAALHLCLELLSKQEEVWSLKLEQEVEKNKALTEALQTLATEHHELKQSLSKSRRLSTLSTLTGDEFYDALSESESELSVSGFLSVASQSCEEDEGRDTPLLSSLRHPSILRGPTRMSGEGNHGNQSAQCNGVKKHRTSLPTPMFSRNDVSIWSILKKCIGMELSKIAMPVIFNEPLSFLQRLTEYMEHTYLIHQANASFPNGMIPLTRHFLNYFTKTGKPFNPLLGETFELIRDDLGFRWVSEQVSHHPPVSAFHAEGLKDDFVFHGSIYPKLKFWGKSIEAEPRGIITLELPKYNEAYTWTNPTCCVHNIIVGQLWIEQYGNVEVINHKTGERCSMTFKPCGLFGKELHKVEGYILDKSKKKLCAVYGKWTECLYTVDPATFDAHKKSDKKNSDEKKGSKQEPEETPPPDAETVQVIPGSELIWKITPRPDNSAKFYAFSTFAMQLNELDKSMEGVIPPTDSRLRPDIRAMENGDIGRVRGLRKNRECPLSPMCCIYMKSMPLLSLCRWFQQGPNPHNKAQDWIYLKGYWDRNYPQLPDIY
uniref:Oxysterol-binding protein n=1 Tax=Anabas testudineus TaxID=64144 RepID=A0A3Q1HZQ0_ANATE